MRIAALLTAAAMMGTAAHADGASIAATDGDNSLGKLQCAASVAQALGPCHFEFLKGDSEDTVRVLIPGGKTRSIYFKNGKATSADSADKLSASERGGVIYVFVGEEERYEIPAALFQ